MHVSMDPPPPSKEETWPPLPMPPPLSKEETWPGPLAWGVGVVGKLFKYLTQCGHGARAVQILPHCWK